MVSGLTILNPPLQAAVAAHAAAGAARLSCPFFLSSTQGCGARLILPRNRVSPCACNYLDGLCCLSQGCWHILTRTAGLARYLSLIAMGKLCPPKGLPLPHLTRSKCSRLNMLDSCSKDSWFHRMEVCGPRVRAPSPVAILWFFNMSSGTLITHTDAHI